MSTADIPPFVFAFKMIILIVIIVTACLVGKFLFSLCQVAGGDDAKMKREWKAQKKREVKEKRELELKKAKEEAEARETTEVALQLVEEMVDLVVSGSSALVVRDGAGRKLTPNINLSEMLELRKKKKREEEQKQKKVKEVQVEIEKKEQVAIELPFCSKCEEEEELDSDATTGTPVSSSTTTTDDAIAAAGNADDDATTPTSPSSSLKAFFLDEFTNSNHFIYPDLPSPRPPPFSSLMISLQPLPFDDEPAFVPASPSFKKQDVFSVA